MISLRRRLFSAVLSCMLLATAAHAQSVHLSKSWTDQLESLPQDCTEECEPASGYVPLHDFGTAVGVSDRSALVGMPAQSRVATFKLLNSQEWQRQGILEPLDRVPGDGFGRSIAFEGRKAAIGAAGAVYIFRQSEIQWTQLAKLVPPAGQPAGDFGAAVKQSDLTTVVGAPADSAAGSVYVFETDGAGQVIESTRLSAPDGVVNDHFGARIAFDGTVLVTSGLSSAHGNRWVVYIYRRLNGGWNLSQVFEPVTDPESIGRITGLEVQGANLFIGTIPSARNSIYSDGRLHIFNATSSGDFVLSQSMSAPRQGIEYELHIYGFGDRIVATPSHVVLSTVEGLQYGGDELLSVFVFDRTPLGLVLSSETVFGGTHADIAIAGSTIVAGLPSYSFGPYPGKGDAYTITAGNAACSRASSIVVDGSSADWAGVPRQKVGGYFANSTDFISPSGDADLSAMFRVQWDANRLYVIVEVQDDLVGGTSTGVYNNDSVELYLDGGHQQSSTYDADDYQLTVDWRGVRGGFRGQLIAYDSAVTITPTGYNVEYSIPWSALGSGSVAAGRIIGLDVALNDNDTGNATRNHHIVWYGDGTGWNDASQFADYSLSADICGGIAVTACARSATVTIDGNAGEWSNIPQHPIGATAAVAGRPASDNDSSGSFRFQWDQSNLYALIEVRDDINGSAASAVYLNDGVELYLDGLRERSHAYDSNDYQLTVDRLGRKGGTRGNALTYTSAVASRPDGFAVEYAVPWSALGLTPSSFRVLGFDVAINDSDNSAAQRESQIIWKGNGLGWYDTSTFDGLELGAATCP